tara:strand:+ start:708 stop:1037 length:330 start_codon:yes stop_codon:yes gene_type:complete
VTRLSKVWLIIQAALNWFVWIFAGYILTIVSLDSSSATTEDYLLVLFFSLTVVVLLVQLYGLYWLWSDNEMTYYKQQFIHAPSWAVMFLILGAFTIIMALSLIENITGK